MKVGNVTLRKVLALAAKTAGAYARYNATIGRSIFLTPVSKVIRQCSPRFAASVIQESLLSAQTVERKLPRVA